MTLTEKILAAHAGRNKVSRGDTLKVSPDLITMHDADAPAVIRQIRSSGMRTVFNPEKIVMVQDHYVPARDIVSAENSKIMREFAQEYGVTYFEIGRAGISHALVPEKGLVMPGDLVIGTDTHTCTFGALGAFAMGMGSTDISSACLSGETRLKVPACFKLVYRGKLSEWVGGKDLILHTIGDIGVDGARGASMEFTGEGIDSISMDGRFTMANMAIQAGAVAGIFKADSKTLDYLKCRGKSIYTAYEPDGSAGYAKVITYDLSQIEPQVALPPLPSNVKPISQIGEIEINQVFIGSCTNGRLDDLRIAARILKTRRVHPKVRCIIIPATQQTYLKATEEGLVAEFIRSGAVVSAPSCGPCAGGQMGVLASGERCISTTNRNSPGRMGALTSEVYLAGPAVAAASAILGRICSPEEVVAR